MSFSSPPSVLDQLFLKCSMRTVSCSAGTHCNLSVFKLSAEISYFTQGYLVHNMWGGNPPPISRPGGTKHHFDTQLLKAH